MSGRKWRRRCRSSIGVTFVLHSPRHRINHMTAIRVIFDGKTFVPQQPVSLPDQSEALVIVEQNDPTAQEALDAAVRAYYQRGASDAEDEDWEGDRQAIAPRGMRIKSWGRFRGAAKCAWSNSPTIPRLGPP